MVMRQSINDRALGRDVERLRLLVLSLLLVVLGACATPVASDKQQVVVSFYPLEYLAKRIGGDRIEVTTLVPSGVEPHDWEPSPRDIGRLQQSKVFVYNGRGIEPWAERALAELPDGKPVRVDASDGLDELEAIEESGHDEAHQGEEHEGIDPHVWLDPHLYAQQAKKVRDALVAADPQGATMYDANLARLTTDVTTLRQDMEAGLTSCQRDTIVTSHAAFGYLAHHFNLKQVALSGLSPEAEPSPARMKELIDEVKATGATHIFFEALVSPRVAETIAQEVGAATLVLNPLEGLTRDELAAKDDYLSVMRENLANLRTALGCQ